MSTARKIDDAIGKVIRLHRRAAALSQSDLAQASGVKFQQVQKYESGANRVSVSRLFAIASALNVSPASLVELVQDDIRGIDDEEDIEVFESLELLSDKNIRTMLMKIHGLKNPAIGKALANLINELDA